MKWIYLEKNIQDKLKLIDQQESQRDYDQDIAKLEKERNDIQGQYNLLLLDNSHEAKSKRKKFTRATCSN